MDNEFYRKFRQITPSGDLKFISEYDFEGSLINNLQQQNPEVIYTQVLDLTTAQSVDNPVTVPVTGRGAVIYGYASDTEFNPTANTGTEVSEPSAFVNARVNWNKQTNAMHMKHNRGFRGSFNALYLSWPAQANVKALLVIFKADAQPWISGESDNRFNSVEASKGTIGTVVTVGTSATLLGAASISRKCLTVYNNAATTIYLIGSNPNDVNATAANGIPLLQNNAAFWRNTGALYAITAAGSNTNIRVSEET